jgi:predicted nuclease with RNAse H fold
MLTLGIDLSSQPKDTAACLIDWRDPGHVVVRTAATQCDDTALDTFIREADAIGIDAPLGWPVAFTVAVGNWTATTWDNRDFQKSLRLRLTDIEVHALTKLTPLSVSTDRIGLPAMRAMALLARHAVTDRSGGDGRFFEVYPAGSLKQWGLRCRAYKGPEKTAIATRRALLAELRQAMPALQVDASYAQSDHAFDALIASLTTRAAALGQTLGPSPEQRPVAKREGWIHLPKAGACPE